MSRIPLHDVIAHNRSVQSELDAAWQSVNQSGTFLNGPQVRKFELDFAEYIGTDQCIGVGNATDGFEIAFQALGLTAHDEIIIPANAHVSPALAALKIGVKPVFCDVNEERMLLNAETVASQISNKTKAVIAVHLYGRVCPMGELRKLCNEKNLLLIEDFSQAHGATFNGKKVGSFGDVSVCSFYPTKPLGALGDGGAILTSNLELADRCKTLANYGWNQRDNATAAGRNSRLDELQASFLNVKLKYLDQWNLARVELAQEIQCHLEAGDICHLHVVRSGNRDELVRFLNENGAACQVHYPIPIHKQSVFNSDESLPISEKLSSEVLSVPLNHEVVELLVSFKEIQKV